MSDRDRPAAYTPAIRSTIALAVTEHWINAIMRHPDLQVDWRAAAHPLACVRAALGGETDPEQLGIEPGEDFNLITRLAAEEVSTHDGSFACSIRGCARCDGDHEDVTWLPLSHPITDSDGVWTHWVPCPTNGQPILMQNRGSGDGD